MNDPPEAVLAKRLRMFAAAAALGSFMTGVSILAGWALHFAVLVTWGARTTMAPTAGACFLLTGTSLWLIRNEKTSRRQALIARSLAALAGLAGVLTLGEQILGLEPGLDWLFLAKAGSLGIADARVRMSPIAAVVFVLLSLALLLIDWRTRRNAWPAQFVAVAAAMAAAFGLLGHLLQSHASAVTMALPTASTGLLMALGLVCARSPWAMSGLLVSDTQAASWLRRTLPAAFLGLGLLGWEIAKSLLAKGLYTWMELSALAVLYGAILAGFLACIAFIVDRGERKREQLERALRAGDELSEDFNPLEQPQEETEIRHRVKTGFALAILLTCMLSFLSWRMARRATSDARWVAQTYEVSSTLEATLLNLVEVETAGQGFALTGNQPFLSPYQAARHAVEQDLLRLHFLISDSTQQRRLQTLQIQTNNRMESLADAVTARKEMDTLPSEIELQRGVELTGAVRATIREMVAAQQRLLVERSGRAQTAQHFNLWFIVLSALAGMVFLVLAGATVSREVGISARARSQVIALNANLELRVAQRAKALEVEIAARAQTNARLRDSEGHLGAILHSAMDAIVTADEQQRIVLFNRAAESMFICPASEAVGQPMSRFVPQRFRAAHREYFHKLSETGVTNLALGSENLLWGVRADGEEFQIEASISKAVIDGKKLFTIITRDVTERVRAEAAREHLAAVVSSSDDAIISEDLEGTVTAWNLGAEKIFGYAPAEIIGQPLLLLSPSDRFGEEDDIRARIVRGHSVQHFETVRVRKDGCLIHVSVTISPLRDGNGKIVGASKIARDITERKQAEEALTRSQHALRKLNESLEERIAQRTLQLEEANHELEAFTYSVSHDLRAPLRRILGFASAFLEEYGDTLDSHALHYVQRMQEGTRRMSVLTDELLNLAKTGQKPLRMQPTKLQTLVEEIISMLKGETEAREVEWRIGELPTVACDPVLVRQIFQNLLSNAIKYSRPRQRAIIEVGHTNRKDGPVIYVRDNGVGFKMEFADKLFGVFQRLHSDEEFEGTGIGLATVHRIVSRHGGTVWAEAEINRGATFYFTLPVGESVPLPIEGVSTSVG